MSPVLPPTGTDRPPLPSDPAAVPGPLHADTVGQGRRLVLAHGFTQTGRLWGGMDRLLAQRYQVVSADLPGHGRSSAVRADLLAGADLLAAVGGRAAYLGYSMGARFCLHVALARPGDVSALVLISGTAGLESAEERAARRRADGLLADQLDPPDRAPGHCDADRDRDRDQERDQERVDRFLDRWLAQPLFADVPEHAAGRDERRTNTPDGLASSLRMDGTGTQEPLWARLGELSMPVLLVTGENDAKFTELNRRMAAAIGPRARHAVVDGAGHSPHLVRPDLVASLVEQFLDENPDTGLGYTGTR